MTLALWMRSCFIFCAVDVSHSSFSHTWLHCPRLGYTFAPICAVWEVCGSDLKAFLKLLREYVICLGLFCVVLAFWCHFYGGDLDMIKEDKAWRLRHH